MGNSWTLRTVLSRDIRTNYNRGAREIVLGQDHRGRIIKSIPLVTHRGYPMMDADMMTAAQPLILGGRKCFGGVATWQGAILRVSTRELYFEKKDSTFFPLENSWIGVETLAKPFGQDGSRNSGDQQQVILFLPGSYGFVCDNHKRYARINCVTGGRFEFSPAKHKDFAEALVVRALMKCDTHEALTWTKHALQHLDQSNLWNDELRAKLDRAQATA